MVRAPLTVHDLGSGTGSMMRWLAPLLPGPQTWVLHDWNRALLEQAAAQPARDGEGVLVSVRTNVEGLGRLRASALAGASLVTTSALLDVLAREEIEAMVARVRGGGCARAVRSQRDRRGGVRPGRPARSRVPDGVQRSPAPVRPWPAPAGPGCRGRGDRPVPDRRVVGARGGNAVGARRGGPRTRRGVDARLARGRRGAAPVPAEAGGGVRGDACRPDGRGRAARSRASPGPSRRGRHDARWSASARRRRPSRRRGGGDGRRRPWERESSRRSSSRSGPSRSCAGWHRSRRRRSPRRSRSPPWPRRPPRGDGACSRPVSGSSWGGASPSRRTTARSS